MPTAFDELRKFVAPEVLFGTGARTLAGAYASRFGMQRTLVVTDPGVREAGWVEPLLDDLLAHGIECSVFDGVSANPRSAEVMTGAEQYAMRDCDSIVAIGGGSPMDCAKGIGVVASNGGHVLDYAGVDLVESPMPPLICVPTTAGTGADVSQFAIIIDEERRTKAALISKSLIPDVALVDPEPLTTMPAHLTAATGMDALTHAVEAFVSNASWRMTDELALTALRIIPDALPASLADPLDLEARGQMALASLDAGLAFSNASLGAVHALAHALGGRLDSAHGECNALLLGPVMRRNLLHVPSTRQEMIAGALGVSLEGDPARDLAAWFDGFRLRVGIDRDPEAPRLADADYRELAGLALSDACMVTNPWRPGVTDLIGMLHDALG